MLLASSSVAQAQISPMGGPGGGMGGGGMGGPGGATQPSGEEKKEGVATAAPKSGALLPTTPSLPIQKSNRKRWKLLELNGYYRVRTDWFKNFNLGFIDSDALGGAPFPRSLGCTPAAVGSVGNLTTRPCNDTLGSTNMRLRLEPTINLDEGTSVHIQADALDNVLFGEDPLDQNFNGIYNSTNRPPVGAFGNSQSAPQAGVNSATDSLTVKRAWAEVATPIGVLRAGRQPNHWGMGIMFNSGGYNPMDGSYNYDGDFGDSVDRVSFTAKIPGTGLRGMVAVDWDMTRLASNQTSVNNTTYAGHPFDLDDSDDTTGYVAVISKLSEPQQWADTIDRGDVAFDYGVYFEYKTQDWDDDLTGFTLGSAFDASNHYVPREMKTYTPDVWAKLGYGPWQFETELVGIMGDVQHLDEYGFTGTTDIAKFGGVGRATWKGVDNRLSLGIETGFATGDQYDNIVQGDTNVAFQNQLGQPGDNLLTQFTFNRDYHVDLIMWRYLFGAITNTAYIKPFLGFDLTKDINFKIWNVTSFALEPVATPGNSSVYGSEADADISYHHGGLIAGISAGVLFPFGAMAHPADSTDAGGPGFGYGSVTTANGTVETNTGDPGTAYTIQTRLILAF